MCVTPVIVPDEQQCSLPQAPDVLPPPVNFMCTLGNVIVYSIPVLDLREQVQHSAGKEKKK